MTRLGLRNAHGTFVASLAITSLLGAACPVFAAPSQRTFVASYGSDASPNCALLAPCRSFNAAIAQTNPGGEVVILDTAGYGPMVISKSIKIIGPSGVYGGISVQGGASGITTGIVIDAGDTDDVTLRGLDISGVPGIAPLPLIGIDVQNAGAVHIEKSSIGNFTQDASACVNVNVAKTTRVYLIDSFLRECNTSLYANSDVLVTGNRPSVIVDNTRIERGENSGGTGGLARGIFIQGFMDVSLRNSMISRQDVGVQFDNLSIGGTSHLEIIHSELTRNTTGLRVTNTTNGSPQVSIVGSQIVSATDLMQVSNSAIGGNTWIKITDSYLAYTLTSTLSFVNSAADVNTRMGIELIRSEIANVNGNAIDLNATNGCQIQLDMRDSTISGVGGSGSGIKTSGSASPLNVSVIRSTITHTNTAIDHGQGTVQLDGSHVNYNNNDFVNNGSGTIVSNGYNMVYNNTNAPGPTFITPLVIPLK